MGLEFLFGNKQAEEGLTKVYKREVIVEYVNFLVAGNVPFSLALIDIDNFKGAGKKTAKADPKRETRIGKIPHRTVPSFLISSLSIKPLTLIISPTKLQVCFAKLWVSISQAKTFTPEA